MLAAVVTSLVVAGAAAASMLLTKLLRYEICLVSSTGTAVAGATIGTAAAAAVVPVTGACAAFIKLLAAAAVPIWRLRRGSCGVTPVSTLAAAGAATVDMGCDSGSLMPLTAAEVPRNATCSKADNTQHEQASSRDGKCTRVSEHARDSRCRVQCVLLCFAVLTFVWHEQQCPAFTAGSRYLEQLMYEWLR